MADGFIPFSTQLDFIWNELQGKEKAGFGKFLSSGASTPEDFATLWDETYERSGFDEKTGERMGDKKARAYAGSVYNSLQGPEANSDLISPNAKTAFEFFRGKGLSPEMSSGITGRLMVESYKGLNPDARNRLGGGMGSYGIAQWRGSRIQDLANFAGVDINDITKLPNSFEGGGLLSPDAQSAAAMSFGNNEASKMINPLTPPLASAVTQQAPAKRRGLGGLLDYAREVNPETGLSNLQSFGAALDPLIMNPNQRAGDSIRAGGARRVAAGRVNKTVEWLSQNGYEEMAEAVRLNPSIAPNVFSSIAAQRMKGKSGFRVATPEEAAQYGAQAGQFEVVNGVDGKFFSTQKVNMQENVNTGEIMIAKGAELLAASFVKAAEYGSQAQGGLIKIKQLEKLLDNTETGLSAGFISKFNSMFGIDFREDSAAAAEALISQLVPAQRPPGSGVISDADLALYKASLPQIQARPGGNKLIIENMRLILEHNRKIGDISHRVITDPKYNATMARKEISELYNNVMSQLEGSSQAPDQPEPMTREDAAAAAAAAAAGL